MEVARFVYHVLEIALTSTQHLRNAPPAEFPVQGLTWNLEGVCVTVTKCATGHAGRENQM